MIQNSNDQFKDKLKWLLKLYFVEELAAKDIQISKELSKALIPALLDCVDKSIDTTLVEMKKYVEGTPPTE